MIRGTVKLAIGAVGLACFLYVFFLVPLGKRTLFEHVMRIGRTEEAQDLGREVGEAGERVEQEIRDTLHEDAAPADP